MAPCSRSNSDLGREKRSSKKSTQSADSSDSDSDCSKGRSRSGKHRSGSRKMMNVEKDTHEYKDRRERNNIAVKKSRNKSKIKTQQTLDRVNSLREENAKLEGKIKLLTKELSFLKDLFLAHAGSAHGQQLQDMDWETLLSTDGEGTNSEKDEGLAKTSDVNGDAVQNDHKYTVHASIKVEG